MATLSNNSHTTRVRNILPSHVIYHNKHYSLSVKRIDISVKNPYEIGTEITISGPLVDDTISFLTQQEPEYTSLLATIHEKIDRYNNPQIIFEM